MKITQSKKQRAQTIAQSGKPFLRWAGGKTHLTRTLLRFVPKDLSRRRYLEPFLGGGAVFFALSPPKALISDLNPHLMNCHQMVREYPDTVHLHLSKYAKRHSESFYYKLRKEYNNSDLSVEQAARFIYLNKASFNGIFRVNKDGEFNVPYGQREKPAFPACERLRSAGTILRKATLLTASYEEALKEAERGDFVYLDPPYPPLNGTACFTHYTKERFGYDDQEKLAQTANGLNRRKCLVMISNADTAEIRSLYRDWRITALPVTRWITCKTRKHKVSELVITNY